MRPLSGRKLTLGPKSFDTYSGSIISYGFDYNHYMFQIRNFNSRISGWLISATSKQNYRSKICYHI